LMTKDMQISLIYLVSNLWRPFQVDLYPLQCLSVIDLVGVFQLALWDDQIDLLMKF